MRRDKLAIGQLDIGKEALIALDQAAFDQGFGELHSVIFSRDLGFRISYTAL